jgi:hypothetical protein
MQYLQTADNRNRRGKKKGKERGGGGEKEGD